MQETCEISENANWIILVGGLPEFWHLGSLNEINMNMKALDGH